LEEQEFVSLITQHQGIIRKICYLYCQSHDDRNDLFQEILMQAWSSVPRFRREAKFSTWLYQVAINTAVSRFKKWKRQPEIKPIDFKLDISESLDEEEKHRFEIMYKAIVSLYFDDLDYRTIGEMLGMTENNVAVKMNRIRTALKQQVSTFN
jgi:RNA polymerase sigma-70 factor (ECF subfamily)